MAVSDDTFADRQPFLESIPVKNAGLDTVSSF